MKGDCCGLVFWGSKKGAIEAESHSIFEAWWRKEIPGVVTKREVGRPISRYKWQRTNNYTIVHNLNVQNKRMGQ